MITVNLISGRRIIHLCRGSRLFERLTQKQHPGQACGKSVSLVTRDTFQSANNLPDAATEKEGRITVCRLRKCRYARCTT